MTVYGIPNCDTVKKALTWLRSHNIDFEFHDFKKLGISGKKLKDWNKRSGYEKFLNKKGTTWRDLPAEVKDNVLSANEALPLLEGKTSMIKRPVIEDGSFLFFGFDEEVYKKHFLQPDKTL